MSQKHERIGHDLAYIRRDRVSATEPWENVPQSTAIAGFWDD